MKIRPPIVSPRAAGLLLAAGLAALASAIIFGLGPPPHSPSADPSGIRRLTALRGATPEAARRAEIAADAAKAALETPAQFGDRLRAWSPAWRADCRATEPHFGLEVRRYRLTAANLNPRAWSAALALLRALANEPGITIEQLLMAAAPEGGGGFTQLQVELTVRLRP